MKLLFDEKVEGWRCPLCKHKWTKKEIQEQIEPAARKANNLNELFAPRVQCDECGVPLCPVWI